METSSAPGHEARANSPAAAWLILAVLLLFSIAAPLNQFKVPPILPVLMEALGLSVSGAGLLMSLYSLTGLLLALPSGFIYQKAGPRVTGLLAGGSIVLGAALGALGASTGVLLAGRVIEGAGTSFMAVLAPAIIARWFVARQRGTALGIWSIWVPVGSVSMVFVAPALAQSAGWRAVWWLGAGYALLVTLLYLLVVKPAPAETAAPQGQAVSSAQVLRNRSLWLLAVAFAAHCASAMGGATYLSTFLTSQHGLSLTQAAWISSIGTLIVLFSAPAGGLLSDRTGSRKRVLVAGLAAAVILLPLVGFVSVAGVMVLMVLQGLVVGTIVANILAAAVEAVGDERQSGAAMAVLMVGQNAGMLLGPLVFGALVEGPGWQAAYIGLAVLAAAAVLAAWLVDAR